MLQSDRLSPGGLILSLATVAFLVGATMPSDASRRGYSDRQHYVSAESRFGHGTVVGPVRWVRVGLQVRTPKGTWLDCARSCAETLRVNTVDFWENELGAGSNGNIDSPDGVFDKWFHWQRRY